jgi:hypothetical protein
MAARLCLHAGARRVQLNELAAIPAPPATRTWNPVPHHEFVTEIMNGLDLAGIAVMGHEFAVGGVNDALLFGTLTLRVPGFEAGELQPVMGLRTANNKSLAHQVIAGANVFVCDNMAFSGSGIKIKRKHTRNVNAVSFGAEAVARYLESLRTWFADIEVMRGLVLSDEQAKALIYDACLRLAAIPLTLARAVHNAYFDDADQKSKHGHGNLWALNNAFTEAVKKLPLQSQNHHDLKIGRFFEIAQRRLLGAPSLGLDRVEDVYADAVVITEHPVDFLD